MLSAPSTDESRWPPIVAVVVFIAGFVLGLTTAVVVIVVTALIVGSLFLAPAIVAGYGVKAADREDRELGRDV